MAPCGDRVLVGGARVRDLDREVDHAVAVLGDVRADPGAGVRLAGDDEPGADPDSRTYSAMSRLPFSGPRYATQRMPNAVE